MKSLNNSVTDETHLFWTFDTLFYENKHVSAFEHQKTDWSILSLRPANAMNMNTTQKHMIMFCVGMNCNNNNNGYFYQYLTVILFSLSFLFEVVILPVRHLLVKLPSPGAKPQGLERLWDEPLGRRDAEHHQQLSVATWERRVTAALRVKAKVSHLF